MINLNNSQYYRDQYTLESSVIFHYTPTHVTHKDKCTGATFLTVEFTTLDVLQMLHSHL